MWDSATDWSNHYVSSFLEKSITFLPYSGIRGQRADKLRNETMSTRRNILVQSVDVKASGSDWSVIIQPQDSWRCYSASPISTCTLLLLAQASVYMRHSFLQIQSEKGRRKSEMDLAISHH